MPQCESSEDVIAQVQKISIEHKEQRVRLSHFSVIRIRSEELPESRQKYQIELKIFSNPPLSESEIKKYLKHMKTLDQSSHEIMILQ